MSMIFLLL